MNDILTITWQDPIEQKDKTIESGSPLVIGRGTGPGQLRLDSPIISTRHAQLETRGGKIVLTDLGSKNGTLINGQPIATATELDDPGRFQIGPIEFKVEVKPLQIEDHKPEETALTFHPETDRLRNQNGPLIIGRPSIQLDRLLKRQTVTVAECEQIAPVETFSFCAVGGGLGSFTWVDHLVIFGADPNSIVSIGYEPKPYGRYRQLCENSQIPDHERLRSNSDSCPDNIWGWPGYAVREFWSNAIRLRWGQAIGTAWQIFNEPYVQTYTPKSGRVFDSIDREADRIGWHDIFRRGRVRAIRKTDDGRYAIFYSRFNDSGQTEIAIVVTTFVHLAVGYPGVRFLPDLKAYRDETGDYRTVVNAYEKHDHIYEQLARQGGSVVIRGRGIVSSRVIQKIKEVRESSGQPIEIIHLMRSPNTDGNRYRLAQREVAHHWEFQPFNWPKAAWGGDLRAELARSDSDRRDHLLTEWGGTTTADRRDWRDMIDQGLADGWYSIRFGSVQNVQPHASGRVISYVRGSRSNETSPLVSDFIIDATGLESGIDRHALLKDMVEKYGLGRNPKGRLLVDEQFAVEGMENRHGRVYAAGVSTLGGPYAPVDSFLGLQFAAQRAVDHCVQLNAPQIRRLNRFRSLGQWWRWAIGVKP